MKIGHFMSGIWDRGGVASYIGRVGDAQTEAGHEVYYLDVEEPMDETVGGSKARTIGLGRGDLLYPTAERLKLDILHIHTLPPNGNGATVPTIRTVHGHQPYCPSGERFFKRSSLPCPRSYSLLGCAAAHFTERCGSIRPEKMLVEFQRTWDEKRLLASVPVLTVSAFLKEQMVRSGYAESSISVLYHPVVEQQNLSAPPSDGDPRFLFVGRMSPTKGLGWLIRAIEKVRTSVHLDVAGIGDEESDMRTLARKLGLADRVTFHGWVDDKKVQALLAQSRALIFPSIWHEPAGLVAFEAMASGRAIVGSRVGGIPESVRHGVNGLIVEPGDVEGLARCIDTLAEDWTMAKDLGCEGRTIAKAFSMQNHLSDLLNHYERCIATAAHPGVRKPQSDCQSANNGNRQ